MRLIISRHGLVDRCLTGEAAYPLSGLLSLTMFNRLIYLQPSGLIVNSGKLDLLFTLPMESELLGVYTEPQGEGSMPSLLLLQPSMRVYNESLPSITARTYSDNRFLQDIPKATKIPENNPNLVMRTSSIHLENDNFDVASFIENTAYIHISDPGMSGPEYDTPRSGLLRARPKQTEQRKVWDAVYEKYREQRMAICGLDLEPVTSTASTGSSNNRVEKESEKL